MKESGCEHATAFFFIGETIRRHSHNLIPTKKANCLLFNAKTAFSPRIGNKSAVNSERYRRIAMPYIFAHCLNRHILR